MLDVDRVARVLLDSDADIIGLQEVGCGGGLPSGESQLASLARTTGLHAIAGPTFRQESGYFGNALLTRHAVGDVARIDATVEGREPRGILHAKVDIGRRSIELFNTHFGLRIGERSRQVERLLAVAEVRPGTVLVVLGDFNEWRSRAAALVRLGSAFGATPAIRSFPSRFPILALDRIWVHPRDCLVGIEAIRTPLARIASDHLPICAELRL